MTYSPHPLKTVTQAEWDQLIARVEALEGRLRQGHSADLVVMDEKPTKAKRASRLPENWLPSQATVEKMMTELRAGDTALHREHLKFMDYFLSAPGQKGVKVDWDRAWCNWMRTADERGNLGVTGRRSAVAEKQQGWSELNIGS